MEAGCGFRIQTADPRIEQLLSGQSPEQAIRFLVQADSGAGLFTYDHTRTPFYQVTSPDGDVRFALQLLERRADRPKEPRDRCPLDLAEVVGKAEQHWFTFTLSGRVMVALANPFPFLCSHVTVASSVHEQQFWHSCHEAQTRGKIERAVRDLYRLASALPSFLALFNASREVGASLPDHQHYQVAELPPGFGMLAIQQVAARHPPAPLVHIGFDGNYPVCAARFTGTEETVVKAAADFLEKWGNILKNAATANIIALTENGAVATYVILRNALFRLAQGFHGVLGSMEVAGLIILSSDYEFKAVRKRRFGFGRVWGMLLQVRPPEAKQML
jgi:Domain of unknown function (DUF4922)